MYASLKSEDIVCFIYITQIMQFSFWQVYYCSSAISFFDGFRSLPCFSATSKRRTAVGLLLRLFRKIFAVHRQRTATHTVYSTQARLIVPRNSLPRCRRRHLRIFLCEYALSDILSTLHSTAEFTNKKEPEAKASGSLRLCAYFIMISAMNTRSVSPVLSSA